MRWPWRRHQDPEAHRARLASEQAVEDEERRLREAAVLGQRLARHRERNRFAEAMRVAFGGRPGAPQ